MAERVDRVRVLGLALGAISRELIARKVFTPDDFTTMAEILAHRMVEADRTTAEELRMASAMLSDFASDGFIDPP